MEKISIYSSFLFARPSFIGGIARLFDFQGSLNTYNSSPHGDIADQKAIYSDWKALGDDMRNAYNSYLKTRGISERQKTA